jgi:hypothetical protein
MNGVVTFFKILVMIFLAGLAAGSGLCALTSVVFAFNAPAMLGVGAIAAGICWVCILALKALGGPVSKTEEPTKPATPE